MTNKNPSIIPCKQFDVINKGKREEAWFEGERANICLHTHSRLVFLPTFTCLMLHKSHLNVFFLRLGRPDFQQLRDKSQFR